MNPKYEIIKIYSKSFYSLLIRELTNYKRLNFFHKKVNGIYTIAIKCQSYYENTLNRKLNSNIYLSYIYVYTSISLILSELIIKFFERRFTYQILSSKYNYLSQHDFERISNIVHVVLDSNYPSIEAKKLYLYRKDLILNKLLLNFRTKNYIYVDFYAYFKLNDYHSHLENIIEKTYSHYWH